LAANCLYIDGHIAATAEPFAMTTPGSTISAVYSKLGGFAIFGRSITSEGDLAIVVAGRIPIEALDNAMTAGFSAGELGRYVIPARTVRHRRKRHEPLTIDESDRLVRITRLQTIAEDVLGDPSKARRWLRERLDILNGDSPLEFGCTDAGARVVEQILAKIDWGAAV
jgi:putative toxin-antitoxin system antitoxin component (TIGR02293 family)